MVTMKALVVDDEPDIVALLKEWLEIEGYEVYGTTDPMDALGEFSRTNPAFSIVDLRMPKMDGFQLISAMRTESDAPILIMSGLVDDDNVVKGLEIGADDYLTKPISRQVFLSKIAAVLRRSSRKTESPNNYADASISMDFPTREVRVHGQLIHLRPIEFRLLACLTLNEGRVVPYQEILAFVWGERGGSQNSLKWYISALREKIGDNSKTSNMILNASKAGYRYVRQNAE